MMPRPGQAATIPNMYDLLFRHVLNRVDPENAHSLTLTALKGLQRVPGALSLVRRAAGPPDPALPINALGHVFAGPLGMAAGFDKDAEVYDAVGAFGFAFVEVGTVTAQPQPGNPRPRMARLAVDHALINRMGFNNHGAVAAAGRLARPRPAGLIVGANIGKTKLAPAKDTIADYTHSARTLAPHADYLVVNVSSPNTPGLRDLQQTEHLRPLLSAVLGASTTRGTRPPVLVKIAPDLAADDIDAIADLAVEMGLDGLIAVNTTVGRQNLQSDQATVQSAGGGGLSGPPLKDRAMKILRRLHARVGRELTLISVGGIQDADDAWDRIAAGATLLQAYTGVVYAGPGFARSIHEGLIRRLRAEGFDRLQQVIGSAGDPPTT